MSSAARRAVTTEDPVAEYGPFELAEHFADELAKAGKIGRSEATRSKLLIATTQLLQESGSIDLKVADICQRAGVAHGTFYLHWKDRHGAVAAVITGFMQTIRARRAPAQPGQSFQERLVAGHLYYIEVYRRNAGLMRSQRQLSDQMPEFAAIGLQANLSLARRVLRAAGVEAGMTDISETPERLAMALACIGMVDKLLYDIFLRRLDLGMDDMSLARMLAGIWYKALVEGV